MNDHFFIRVLRATLALDIWALHFALCYGLAAAQCTPAWQHPGGPSRLLLGVATVAAVAACTWVGWRARARLHGTRRDTLVDYSAVAGSVLAGVAIAWNGIPLLLASGCA